MRGRDHPTVEPRCPRHTRRALSKALRSLVEVARQRSCQGCRGYPTPGEGCPREGVTAALLVMQLGFLPTQTTIYTDGSGDGERHVQVKGGRGWRAHTAPSARPHPPPEPTLTSVGAASPPPTPTLGVRRVQMAVELISLFRLNSRPPYF